MLVNINVLVNKNVLEIRLNVNKIIKISKVDRFVLTINGQIDIIIIQLNIFSVNVYRILL